MPISKVQDGPPSPATAGSVCAFASASNPAYGVAGNERAENVVESPRVLQPDCLAARAGRFYTAIRWQEVDISLIQSVTLEGQVRGAHPASGSGSAMKTPRCSAGCVWVKAHRLKQCKKIRRFVTKKILKVACLDHPTVARHVGMSTINDYLNNDGNRDYERLKCICEALNIIPDILMPDKDLQLRDHGMPGLPPLVWNDDIATPEELDGYVNAARLILDALNSRTVR